MHKIPYLLLIEDNEDDYEATVRSLKKNRFLNDIKWCRSGDEAISFLFDENLETLPALILLDLNMPGLDGREVLKRIKSQEVTSVVPVVILTTSKDLDDVERCYKLGASTYIQKPVDFGGLTQAIHTMKDYWFGVAVLPKNE